MFGILGDDLERIYFCILDIRDILNTKERMGSISHPEEADSEPLHQLAGHLGVSLINLKSTLAAENKVILFKVYGPVYHTIDIGGYLYIL